MNLGKESDKYLQVIPHACQEEDSNNTNFFSSSKKDVLEALSCPSCGFNIQVLDQRVIHELPGLPAGVKFDPSDVEILEHLEAKVLIDKGKLLHPLIDQFIPTIEGENGICYTHPENLPGVSKEGQIRHFFHKPSKAYTTGNRKRRKVITEEEDGSGGGGGGETRWHKTGKTRAIYTSNNNNKAIKGYKKILVLYSYYGSHRKPDKTNWIMHQYHLGVSEDEKDGELVVSKVFYQTQPRQPNTADGCRKKIHEVHEPSYLHVGPPLTEEPHKKTRPSSLSTDELIASGAHEPSYLHVGPPLKPDRETRSSSSSSMNGHYRIDAMNDTNVLITTHRWWTGDEDHKYVNTIIKNTTDFGPNQFNYVMGNGEYRQSLPMLLIPDEVSHGEESSFLNLPSDASKRK